MTDPYRMVLIDIVASLIIGTGIFVYSFVLKKKINYLYLLLILSLLPLISILRKGSYESGDLSLHAKLTIQFYENLQQGNLIPSWLQRHCLGYGCPGFTFLFLLPYYLTSFFHFIGFSFIASVKMLISVSFILSGVGMYYWVKEQWGDKSGFVAAIFYLYAPYHLIDLHFRISIGELVSMAILPFLFLTIKLFLQTNQAKYIATVTVLIALLILSHQVTSLISMPFIFIYILMIWLQTKKRNYISLFFTFTSCIFGMLFSTFYWLPIILEKKYILYGSSAQIEFHKFSEFFFSPYRMGLLFQGRMGEIYMNIGYTQLIIICFSLFLLYKNRLQRINKQMLLFFLSSIAFLFIFMQSFTKFLWDLFSFTKSVQFSWRLMIEVSLFTSVVAGITVQFIKSKKLLILLCTLTILYTILNWGNRKSEPLVNDEVLKNQTLFVNTDIVEITTPVWTNIIDKNTYNYQNKHIEILSGEATILPLEWLQTKHQYLVDVEKKAIIKENTFYYPGWKIYANDKELPINYLNPKYPGVMTVHLDKGLYKLDVVFLHTYQRNIGLVISGLSMGIYIIFIVFFKKLQT